MSTQPAAVIFVDLQEGLVEASQTQTPAQVRRGARALAQMARALGLPCVASGIAAGPQGVPPLLSELTSELPGLKLSVRQSFGALGDPQVLAAIQSGLPDLWIAGVLTEGAVLKTALEARANGHGVRIVLDACAGLSDRTEAAALRQIEASGAIVTSLPSLAGEYVVTFGSEAGRSVLAALYGLLPPSGGPRNS